MLYETILFKHPHAIYS